MCGRYALALRPSQIRRMLEEDDLSVAHAPDDEGGDSSRQSYNFAPGYNGLVYRADIPDRGHQLKQDIRQGERMVKEPHQAGSIADAGISSDAEAKYKLQAMRWGLVPSWAKRAPHHASVMRTINCRDDSLSTSVGGMWQGLKGQKRCIVLAQGFFEWLDTGSKNKLPHYVRRKDGRLMYFAGLWDCAKQKGAESNLYSYTIITTDSNEALSFLHDRMPVIFNPSSNELLQWVDTARPRWSQDLQCSLKPFDGELEVYPVKQEVSKVGNDSPSLVLPLDSEANKSNIIHFFKRVPTTRADATGTRDFESLENSMTKESPKDEVPCAPETIRFARKASVERKRTFQNSEGNTPVKQARLRQLSTHNSTQKILSNHPGSTSTDKQKITKFFSRDA